MKQVQHVLSTYSADLFGVCSALYELGGLIVMHDASGCNSTYNTHDEPRWYDIESMVYISGLDEKDAVLGNDDRLIDDICEAAYETSPEFIAVSGSPVTSMMGTDFRGIGRVIEARTGIPVISFNTGCMNTYQSGAAQAFEGLVRRFCTGRVPAEKERHETGEVNDRAKSGNNRIKVNLIGVTPLDFSIVGNVEGLRRFCDHSGFELVSCIAMGDTLERIKRAPEADVNIVVSSTGIRAAEYFKEAFGIPFVCGIPVGGYMTEALKQSVMNAYENAVYGTPSKEPGMPAKETGLRIKENGEHGRETHDKGAVRYEKADISSITKHNEENTWVIGEPVFAASLRNCLEYGHGVKNVRVICPLESDGGVLDKRDILTGEECEIREIIRNAGIVVGDWFYSRLIPKGSSTAFINIPHEAFSGRCFRNEIPVFTDASFDTWVDEKILK